VSSRKLHAWRFRRSEEGKASDTLRCLAEVETETDVEAGVEVVSEFEVEGKGEGFDVDVVMARVRIVADVERFEDEEGRANAFWKKAEEEEAIVRGGSSWIVGAEEWRRRRSITRRVLRITGKLEAVKGEGDLGECLETSLCTQGVRRLDWM